MPPPSAPIALEQYLLLLLSDSNLPSGGFVASSGLESYITHGFLSSDGATTKVDGVIRFVRKSVHAYARLQLPFVRSVHQFVSSYTDNPSGGDEELDKVVAEVVRLDAELESMTLNHVARRASTAQGVALLTLYERALAPPPPPPPPPPSSDQVGDSPAAANRRAALLVERLRKATRVGQASGHQAMGFAVLTAVLGLSLHSAQHLFLFLHARSLLSSAVRLNTLGPYVSHRLLLHDVRPIVDDAMNACSHWRVKNSPTTSGDWRGRGSHAACGADEDDDDDDDDEGPVTTWPLGEILAARHDQLHSKIFNS